MFLLIHKACVEKIIPVIIEHLACLDNRIEEYVPSIGIENFDYICNPFVNLTIANHLSFSCVKRRN